MAQRHAGACAAQWPRRLARASAWGPVHHAGTRRMHAEERPLPGASGDWRRLPAIHDLANPHIAASSTALPPDTIAKMGAACKSRSRHKPRWPVVLAPAVAFLVPGIAPYLACRLCPPAAPLRWWRASLLPSWTSPTRHGPALEASRSTGALPCTLHEAHTRQYGRQYWRQ